MSTKESTEGRLNMAVLRRSADEPSHHAGIRWDNDGDDTFESIFRLMLLLYFMSIIERIYCIQRYSTRKVILYICSIFLSFVNILHCIQAGLC